MLLGPTWVTRIELSMLLMVAFEMYLLTEPLQHRYTLTPWASSLLSLCRMARIPKYSCDLHRLVHGHSMSAFMNTNERLTSSFVWGLHRGDSSGLTTVSKHGKYVYNLFKLTDRYQFLLSLDSDTMVLPYPNRSWKDIPRAVARISGTRTPRINR